MNCIQARFDGQVFVPAGPIDLPPGTMLNLQFDEAARDTEATLQHETGAVAGIDAERTLPPRSSDPGAGPVPDPERTLPPQPGDAPLVSFAAANSVTERYRIVRFHARGGLGQVSVALDEQLKREVALKEIQPQFAGDQLSRARFLLEAEVTGSLEHPGIVPVYSLGQYPDGRPFYAMRFVGGVSMQEAIDRYHRSDTPESADATPRNLEFRGLLRRFIDVCNTIEYAHSRGVLHRDLKPANVMLGSFGETLVVDWGLAKQQGSAEQPAQPRGQAAPSGASTATQFGVAVGTPGYMSPEQAGGRLDELGPASDVYSLGATLYVLLTGTVPFKAADLWILLEQVQEGKFRRPREVLSSVPPALEAICLKAMSLAPQDRYASPRKLAADIEQWLADEPVQAYPDPFVVRARRWVRKHQAPVAGLAATVLVGIVSLGAGFGVVANKNRALVAANDRETKARQLAEANQQRAEEQSQLALETLQTVVFNVQRQLVKVPAAQTVRRGLLQTSVAGLARVAASLEKGQQERDRTTLVAHAELGDIFHRLGDEEGLGGSGHARRQFELALAIARDLAAANPEDPASQRDLAVACNRMGDVSLQMGVLAEAQRYHAESLDIRRRLAGASPADAQAQRDLSVGLEKVGDALAQLERVPEARRSYDECLEIRRRLAESNPADAEHQRDLSISLSKAGNVSLQLAQTQQGLELMEESLRIRRRLAADNPQDVEAQRDLSVVVERMGDVKLRLGDVATALPFYEEALAISRRLAASDPADSQAQRDLSVSLERFGDASVEAGAVQESMGAHQAALEIRRRLAAADPDNLQARRDVAVSLERLAHPSIALLDAKQALVYLQEAATIREQVSAADAASTQLQRDHAACLEKLGGICHWMGRLPPALDHYQAAQSIRQALAERTSDVEDQALLATCRYRLARVQQHLCNFEAAANTYRGALSLQPAAPLASEIQKRLSICELAPQAVANLAFALSQPELASGLLLARCTALANLGRFEEALESARALGALDPSQGVQRYDVACCLVRCAAAVGKEKEQLSADEQAQRQKYLDQARGMLLEAVAAGFNRPDLFDRDPDLALLRDDEGYRQWRGQLQPTSAP